MKPVDTTQHYRFETLPLPLHQLCRFAEKLALSIQAGDVLLLHGELGTGKTTLVQCMALGLGISDDQYVSSPSYALMHEYEGVNMSIYHMDLYRLNDADDVEAAGLLDYFTSKDVCIIEWPDRLGTACPENHLNVTLIASEPASRKILLEPCGSAWTDRISHLRDLCAEFQKL